MNGLAFLRRWWPKLLAAFAALGGLVVSILLLRRRPSSVRGRNVIREEHAQAAAAQNADGAKRDARAAAREGELARKRKIIERDHTRAMESGPTSEAIAEAERDLDALRERK